MESKRKHNSIVVRKALGNNWREPHPHTGTLGLGKAQLLSSVGLSRLAGKANWLRGLDLNQRPLGYEPNELPGCSTPQDHFNNVPGEGQITGNGHGAERGRVSGAEGARGAAGREVIPVHC